jgi:hypothetical protein
VARVSDQVKIKTLHIYCEQVGRRGKDCKKKRITQAALYYVNDKNLLSTEYKDEHSRYVSTIKRTLLIYAQLINRPRKEE